MTKDEFEQLVTVAIKNLPQEFLEKLNNVDIVIDDYPTIDQLRKLRLRSGMTLFGLYEGVPQTKRTANYTMVLPDKITIFQKPIEEFYQDGELIKEQIRRTVVHEIGHHFGMSDEELRKLRY